MGLFEQQPLLLVPLILAVVIAYDGVKWAAQWPLRSVRRAQPDRTFKNRGS
jgi:hypothetical protein